MIGELDPRGGIGEKKVETTSDLTQVILDETKSVQLVTVVDNIPAELKIQLVAFLQEHKDVLTRKHTDMQGID